MMEEKKEILDSSFEALSKAMPELEGLEGVATLLSLPDEQFDLIAPPILLELEKSINGINEKLILVQTLNAGGHKAEDLNDAFAEICEQIDENTPSISNNKKDFIKRMLGALCNAINDTEGISKRVVKIPIEISKDAKLPTYAHVTDAGADIYVTEDITIHPGETKLIPTGVKVAVPVGYTLLVYPKSGIGLKTKMRLSNSVGVIDTEYRGEVGIILDNIEPPIKNITYEFDEATHRPIITSIEHGSDMHVTKGQKIAQLILAEVPKIAFYEIENIEAIEGNRQGGYGSSSIYHKEDIRYGSDLV